MRSLLVSSLLAVAFLGAALGAVGIVIRGTLLERLHYISPPATVTGLCLLAAVAVEEGVGVPAVKTLLVAFVLFVANAVLTHATARAARIRELGSLAVGDCEPPNSQGGPQGGEA